MLHLVTTLLADTARHVRVNFLFSSMLTVDKLLRIDDRSSVVTMQLSYHVIWLALALGPKKLDILYRISNFFDWVTLSFVKTKV